jgi:hypothetical protein
MMRWIWTTQRAHDLGALAALRRRDDDVSSLKSDMALMKWMTGLLLASQVGIFVKLSVH